MHVGLLFKRQLAGCVGLFGRGMKFLPQGLVTARRQGAERFPFFLQGLDPLGQDVGIVRASHQRRHPFNQLDFFRLDGEPLPVVNFAQLGRQRPQFLVEMILAAGAQMPEQVPEPVVHAVGVLEMVFAQFLAQFLERCFNLLGGFLFLGFQFFELFLRVAPSVPQTGDRRWRQCAVGIGPGQLRQLLVDLVRAVFAAP